VNVTGECGAWFARRTACIVALLLVLSGLAASACAGAPVAMALSQRGHVFRFAFGGPGSGEGQFLVPSAVAVDQSDGDVYVADRAAGRVQEFAPEVGPQGEIVGERLVRALAVPSPVAVAVDSSSSSSDPSAGDVYVLGATGKRSSEEQPQERVIYKFEATGTTAMAQIKGFRPSEEEEPETERFEEIQGIAVTTSGSLLVYEEGVDVFNDARVNKGSFSIETPGRATSGLAVDSEDDLFVGRESENAEARGAGGQPSVIAKLGATGEVLIGELDDRPSSAVALNTLDVAGEGVDELNDAYVTNVGSVGGETVSTVAAFAPDGALIQRFGAPGLRDATGVAVDSRNGTVYVTDGTSATVDVFELEAAGPPRLGELSAAEPLGEADTRNVTGVVDPVGADTRAFIEYGPVSCAADPSACATTPVEDLGEGFGDRQLNVQLAGLAPGSYHMRLVASNSFATVQGAEQEFAVAAVQSGLPDGRGWEMVSPVSSDGAEAEALTREGGAVQAAASGEAMAFVADGPMGSEGEVQGSRNPEFTQVVSVRTAGGWVSQDISTPNTAGRGILPGYPPEYQLFSESLALSLLQPFPAGPNASAWAEPALSPPESQAEKQLAGEGQNYQEKTVYERDDAPIEPQASEAASYAAASANGAVMGNAGFLAVVDEADALGVLGTKPASGPWFGGGASSGLELLSGTPDLSHVVLRSYRAAPGLYEWSLESGLEPVSVLPEGEQASEVTLGGPEGSDVSHAISDDGSRVFWTTVRGEEAHLYVRDSQTGETLQLDKILSGSGAGTPDATFQTASADGSRVFFTDTQRLTANSQAGIVAGVPRPDLYVFELNHSAPLSGTLRDLTPEGLEGESADVLVSGAGHVLGGGVLGASEDGSYVYFVANGALAPGASQGDCTTAEEQSAGRHCNLYVLHFDGSGWEPARLIAVLSNEDAPDWGGVGSPGDPAYTTARVSPDGRYLAFMSRERLTGYDNEDQTSKTPGERIDEEVFLYDAASETLACASCDPSGERPEGVLDPGESGEGGAGEGLGLLVDRIGIWGAGDLKVDHWLAGSIPGWDAIALDRALYQPRYLSNQGRLFFNSPSMLVPASTASKEKVYEYEPAAVGSCTSAGGCVALISSGTDEHEAAFLDASEAGNDAFFLTAAKLVPQDTDTNFNVYDARICEPVAPCLTPAPPAQGECEETPQLPCKQAVAPEPAPGSPPTATSSGPEATGQGATLASHTQAKPKPKLTTRAQALSTALALCRKKYKGRAARKKRTGCEASARKRYAPKTPTKKRSKRPVRRDTR
jgi:hypothetical protein